jgi:origin recognition complex subunit 4
MTSSARRRGRPAKTAETAETEPSEVLEDELASNNTTSSARKQIGRTTKIHQADPSETVEDELATAATSAATTAGKDLPARNRRKTAKAAENEELEGSRPTQKLAKKPSIWELRRAATRGAISGTFTPQVPAALEQVEGASTTPITTPRKGKRHTDREPGGETPKPKGILTPSRKDGTPRIRKSVAFDHDETAEQEVFFEDLATKGTAKKAMKPPKELNKSASVTVARTVSGKDDDGDVEMQVGGDEEEDEEVCSICKKPDSKWPNEIIFCDGCDMAVHQKCYNVPTIPEGDWLCRSCSQEDVLMPQAPVHGKSLAVAAASYEQIPKITDFEEHLGLIQRTLMDRCTGRKRLPLRGQDEAYEKAFQLVEQTVLAGEGNSMLVIGARGSGKTTLVEYIVSKMSANHKDEFHVVRLNGFIHTDDKIALKEIWRQLGKEMDVEDDLINRVWMSPIWPPVAC